MLELDKPLSRAEVVAEIEKAKTFDPHLRHYAIATTAKRAPALQEVVREICRANLEAGLFSVEVLSWDDLTDILNLYPEIADDYYSGSEYAPTDRRQKAVSNGASDPVAEGRFHAEIDLAKNAVQRGAPEVALAKLAEVRTRHWDALTPRERYRVDANTGHANTQLGRFIEAGKAFVNCASHQPDDPTALSLRIMGLIYLDETSKAAEEANRMIDRWPDMPMVALTWVSSQPNTLPLSDLTARLSKQALDDAQVLLALGRRARASGDLESAEDFARKAAAKEPAWSEAIEELGEVVLHREVECLRSRLAVAPTALHPHRVREALGHLQVALEMPGVRSSPVREAHLRMQIAIAKQLLGDNDGSLLEVERASELDPTNAQAAKRRAMMLKSRGQSADAIGLLRHVLAKELDCSAAITFAVLVSEHGTETNRDEAARMLIGVLARAQDPQHQLSDVAECLVHIRGKHGAFAKAREELDSLAAGVLPPGIRAVLESRLSQAEGDRARAKAHALEAVSAVGEDGSRDVLHRAATILFELSEYSSSLPILKRTVPPDYVGPDTLRVLKAARECGDDAFILEFCRRLRTNNQFDLDCIQLEVSTLCRYNSYGDAIGVMQWALGQPLDGDNAAHIRLQLSYLGIQANRPDVIEVDPRRLPQVDVVTPEFGQMTVLVLRAGGRLDDAARYSYQLLRRFPDRLESFKAVMIAHGVAGAKPLEVAAYDLVGPGCAFLLASDEGARWYVIEEEDTPKHSLNEIAPSHPLAIAADKKPVGARVEWGTGPQLHNGTIERIVHKYVFRWNECLRTCEEAFPEQALVWSIRMPTAQDGTLDASGCAKILGDLLQRKVDTVQSFLSEYKTLPLPLHLLVRRAGGSQLEAHFFVANREDVHVQCGSASHNDYQLVMSQLQTAAGMMVDISAFGTLLLLDRVRDLERMPFQLVVTQGTVQALRKFLSDYTPVKGEGEILTVNQGKLSLFESTAEAVAARIEKVRELVDLVERKCRIVSGEALAGVDRTMREKLLATIGQASAESAVAARDLDLSLWTDELGISLITIHELKGRVAWTDVVYRASAERGFFSREDSNEVAAVLHSKGFTGTIVTSDVVLAAGRLSDWNPDRPLLRKCLESLSSSNASAEQLIMLSKSIIVGIWRLTALDETAVRVLVRLLDELNKTTEGRTAIAFVRHRLDDIFRFDVISAGKTRRLMDAWRASHP